MSETSFTIRGNITNDINIERIKAFIEFEVQSMIGKSASDKTKPVEIYVVIQAGKRS